MKNAPAVEAIWDVRVKARVGVDASVFQALRRELFERFPKAVETQNVLFAFSPIASAAQTQVQRDFIGLHFHSTDEKVVAQFRVDGFTLNRLRPYSSWDELFPLFLELWERYVSVAAPDAVTRCALRYVNRVAIDAGLSEAFAKLISPPVVPVGLSLDLAAFVSRLTMRDRATGDACHLLQAVEMDSDGGAHAMILDVDAFSDTQIGVDSRGVGAALLRLRTLKNRVFFGSLTEEAIKEME